ncbi:hypothetical protein VSR34_33340, partial [Paraburkholderia sp. JHI2823]
MKKTRKKSKINRKERGLRTAARNARPVGHRAKTPGFPLRNRKENPAAARLSRVSGGERVGAEFVSRRAARVGPSASIHFGSLINNAQIREEQSIQPYRC